MTEEEKKPEELEQDPGDPEEQEKEEPEAKEEESEESEASEDSLNPEQVKNILKRMSEIPPEEGQEGEECALCNTLHPLDPGGFARKAMQEYEDNKYAAEMCDALKSFEFIDVLASQQEENRIRLALRVGEQESQTWNSILMMLIREGKRQKKAGKGLALHICKQIDVTEEPPYRLVYYWNLIVKGEDLGAAVSDICRVLDIAATAPVIQAPREQTKAPTPSPYTNTVPTRQTTTGKPINVPSKPQPYRMQGKKQLFSYPLGANHIVPEVSLMAKSGKRKGAHLISG